MGDWWIMREFIFKLWLVRFLLMSVISLRRDLIVVFLSSSWVEKSFFFLSTSDVS